MLNLIHSTMFNVDEKAQYEWDEALAVGAFENKEKNVIVTKGNPYTLQ